MKKALLILLFITIQYSFAQSGGKLENYPLDEVNMVVFPFGMEYPVKIGTVSVSGEIIFQMPSKIEVPIPPDDVYMSDITNSLFFKCDDGLGNEDLKVLNAGKIALLTKDNRYAGILFAVSNETLAPWVEDSLSNKPVESSFFELIYVETIEDFILYVECYSTLYLESEEVLESKYVYDINLLNGFNFIEYKIESIIEYQHKGLYDPSIIETTAIPSAVSITSTQINAPEIKWIPKYFY